MAEAKAKRLEFAVTLDRDWLATGDQGGPPLPYDPAWTPEHLVLAAAARCTLTSLEYSLDRAGLTGSARAGASGVVTRREEDGRFAFVEVDVAVDVSLEGDLGDDELRALLARTERGCFVGASLTAGPRYRWTVNGKEIEST
jgi:organic hydroperoxide reductase OsmC/OhrA